MSVIIFLAVASGYFASAQMCGETNSVDISKGTHLTNGDIYFNGIKFDNSEYFLDNNGTETGCLCKKEKCLRKCCPFGLAFDRIKKVCVNTSVVFDPPVYDKYNRLLPTVNATKIFHFTYFEKQNCTGPGVYRVRSRKIYPVLNLRKDGKLYVEMPHRIPPRMLFGPDKYCIDTFVTEGQNPSLDALVCFSENEENITGYLISSTCMLISCVFILATVGVYSWLPELRNLHGRVLMACLLSFFVGFLFMATMQILLYLNHIQQNTCMAFTFIIYFFLLSAFFWLNVMCFDIWWTFSSPSGHQGRTPISRFTRYAIYAFSVPTVLTIIMAGLEFSRMPSAPWMPNIRTQGCFLSDTSRLIYLYGPISILCVANLVFFVLTAKGIAQTRRQTQRRLRGTESNTNDRDNQQRLMLYVKLFLVMGINWLLEVISALYPDANCIWQYTDAYNVLIGLIVFIIFVCKRKIFRLLKNRYRQTRGDPISRTATTSSRSISTRDDIQMGSVKATEKNGTNNTQNNSQV